MKNLKAVKPNFIIQRLLKERHTDAFWQDCHQVSEKVAICGTLAQRGVVTDSLGNKGWQSKKLAKVELARIRAEHKGHTYRLIQITQ